MDKDHSYLHQLQHIHKVVWYNLQLWSNPNIIYCAQFDCSWVDKFAPDQIRLVLFPFYFTLKEVIFLPEMMTSIVLVDPTSTSILAFVSILLCLSKISTVEYRGIIKFLARYVVDVPFVILTEIGKSPISVRLTSPIFQSLLDY